MRLTQIENYHSGLRLEDYKCAEITFLEISCLYSSSKISKIMEEREGASLPRSCNILDTTQKLVSIELSEPKIIINVGIMFANPRHCPEYFLNSSSQLRAHVAKTWLGVQKMIICGPRIPGLYLAAQKN